MTLRVSGKNMDIGEALRTHVQAQIDITVRKYAAGAIIGHVTIEPEGSGFRADCTLHLSSGATLQADAKAQEPYASFNRACERLEKRLRRYRNRLTDHHTSTEHAPMSGINLTQGAEPETVAEIDHHEIEDLNPAVIAEPSSGFREMSVSGAVRELDLTNSHVVIFRHAGDGRTNIVYRRPDGNIGWVDPGRI
jgi:ribosomal subunit interface protein